MESLQEILDEMTEAAKTSEKSSPRCLSSTREEYLEAEGMNNRRSECRIRHIPVADELATLGKTSA